MGLLMPEEIGARSALGWCAPRAALWSGGGGDVEQLVDLHLLGLCGGVEFDGGDCTDAPLGEDGLCPGGKIGNEVISLEVEVLALDGVAVGCCGVEEPLVRDEDESVRGQFAFSFAEEHGAVRQHLELDFFVEAEDGLVPSRGVGKGWAAGGGQVEDDRRGLAG